MKIRKLMNLAAFACVLLFTPTIGQAAPFTNPDIYLEGSSYSAVSDPTRWFTMADGSVFTAWSGLWIEYTAYLTVGNWNIGLDVINQGNIGTGWYNEFRILNGLTNTVFSIPASSTEVFNGYFNTNIFTAGTYTVRYTWLNDQFLSAAANNGIGLDANIRIAGAFFKDPPLASVPEPSTLLLFGTGFLGYVLFRIRRRSA